MASRAATSASCVVRSLRRISLRSMTRLASKSLISPAIRLVRRSGSNAAMCRTPDLPATSRSQNVGTSLPSGVTAPMPVTTTRRRPGTAGDALLTG